MRSDEEVLPTGRSYVPDVRLSLSPGDSKQIELRTRAPAVPPEQTVDLRVYHACPSHYRATFLFRGDVPPLRNAQSWDDYEPGIPKHDSKPPPPPPNPEVTILFRSGTDEWDLIEPGTYTLFVLEHGDPANPLRRVLHLDKPGLTIVYPQLGDHPLTCGNGTNSSP